MIRRKRELTEEQKEAARERLALAREAKGPAQYKNIHPDVLELPDDDNFSMKNVKAWEKEAKGRDIEEFIADELANWAVGRRQAKSVSSKMLVVKVSIPPSSSIISELAFVVNVLGLV